MTPMNQLVLQVFTPPRYTLDSIIPHEGIEAALSAIRTVYGEGETPFPTLFISGPLGTGKTHILNAITTLMANRWPEREGAVKLISTQGDPPTFGGLDDIVLGMDGSVTDLRCVAIDDVHLLPEQESVKLWSLYNLMTRIGAPLFLASRLPWEEIFADNPHLKSRVASGLVFRLEPPTDRVRLLILDKMARDRNIRISHDVSSYIVTRKSRSVKDLEKLLDNIDRYSLEVGRRITLPLIKNLERAGAL
jgi:DnaA-homolog protein